MKHSLTYYITLFVIKLKGIKKNFSKEPINFKKIRKEDIHQPKDLFFKKNISQTFHVLDSLITEVKTSENSTQLLIFIHGGAFISGPAQHHWKSVKKIAQKSNHTIWMCDYPKAPENNITKISANIDTVYSSAIQSFQPSNISIIGDSVGGTLTCTLIQRLVLNNIETPSKIILISPVMDASMSNSEIDKLEKLDPMLSKTGVLSAKKMCAKNIDLKDQSISPLYGSFQKFPETILFLSKNDIMYPDGELAAIKLKNAGIKTTVFKGEHMPHIWPLLPVMKEAKTSLNQIINLINNENISF